MIESQDDTIIFYSKKSKIRVWTLALAGALREILEERSQQNNADNNYKKEISRAKILFMYKYYQEAEDLLQRINTLHCEHKLSSTYTLYYVHQLLAQIALRKEPQDYTTAISEFEHCLKIAEDLSLSNTYMEQSELGYLYIICGRLKEAEAINTELLKETQSLAPEIRKTSYADALRNMGYLHYAQEKRQFDIKVELIGAILEYSLAIAPDKLVSFGQARTWWCLANCESSELEKIKDLEIAIDSFNKCVGLDHPEAKECLAQLDELKSSRK